MCARLARRKSNLLLKGVIPSRRAVASSSAADAFNHIRNSSALARWVSRDVVESQVFLSLSERFDEGVVDSEFGFIVVLLFV